MSYKQYVGPRVCRRRRMNRLKAGLLAALLVGLLLSVSWTAPRELPAPAPPTPLPSVLAMARNLYALSGDNGFAHAYLEQWPQYAAYIRGEVDSIEDCE